MTEPLRPMNLGEILDRTFQIYRARFLVFGSVVALRVLAILAVQFADISWFHFSSLVHSTKPGEGLLWGIAVWLAYYHLAVLLSIPFAPALFQAASAAELAESTSIRKALRFAFARWLTYLWIGILKFTAGLIVPEILTLILFAGVAVAESAAGGFKQPKPHFAVLFALLAPLFAGFALFLWAGACLSFATPASAFEGLSGLKALRRSWLLSRGARMRILVTWVVVSTFGFIFAYGTALAFWWVVMLIHGRTPFSPAGQTLYQESLSVVNAVVSILIGPIYPIAVTLIYYDQRIRKEGYDIERMMEAAGLNAPARLPGAEAPAAPVAEDEARA